MIHARHGLVVNACHASFIMQILDLHAEISKVDHRRYPDFTATSNHAENGTLRLRPLVRARTRAGKIHIFWIYTY